MKWRSPKFWTPTGVFAAWLGSMASILYFASALSDRRPNLTQLFSKWDAGWYLSVVSGGYNTLSGQSNVAFFPGYPLLVRGLSWLTHLNALWAGVIVSLICFWAALVTIYCLVAERWNAKMAGLTLWLIPFFPFSFFFGLIYTESLFLLLVAVTLLLVQRRRFWLAAVTAGAASGVRLAGIFLVFAVLWEYLANYRQLTVARLSKAAGLGVVCATGLGAYILYLYLKIHDALAFVHVQQYWPERGEGLRGLEAPIKSVVRDYQFSNPYAVNLAWLAITVVFLALAVYCWMKLSRAWGGFALLALLLPLASGSIISMNRYAMVLIPCFVALAQLLQRRERVEFILVPWAILLALFGAAYVNSMVFLG